MIDLGKDFDLAVVEAAGADPNNIQEGSLVIDMVPSKGPATIRFTTIVTIDSDVLRQLIAAASTSPPAEASTP